MDINKKNRVELKNYFKKNAIPTESNFADFIDAGVNQKEDGLYKPAGEALNLEASLTNPKSAIKFYETFTGNPSWTVSLYEPAAAQAAFVVSDTAGNTRLWIGASDGIVHVGSPATPGALTVGSLTSTGAVSAGSFNTTGAVSTGALNVTSLTSSGAIGASGLVSASAGATVTGAPLNVGTSAGTAQPLNVWGALTANSTITATGLITANGGITTTGTVSTGALTVTSLTSSGAIGASGLVSANAGATVTGAALNVGTSAGTAQPLNVWGVLTANGVITANSTVTATGLITANGGLTTTGAVNTGTLTATGLITANGGITTSATSAITANGGLTVPSGKTLTVSGTLAASTTTTAGLTASGAIAANAGLTVPAGQTLTVSGTLAASTTTTAGLTASGLITANGGLSVASGNLTATNLITANGGLSVASGTTSTGALTASGLITANAGLTVPSTQTLTVNGTLNAGTTNTAALTASGAINANGGISIPSSFGLSNSGYIVAGTTITAGGLITANGGLTVAVGALTANGGVNVTGGTLSAAGTINANGGLYVPSGQTIVVNGSVNMLSTDINIKPPSHVGERLDKNLSQYMATPTIPASIPFDQGVTVQAYIFLYLLEDNARIIDFGNGNASDNILFYTYADGSIGAQVYRGAVAGTALKSTTGLLTVGKWIHVAMTVDNTGIIKIYKDAVLQNTSAASGANVPIAIQRTSNYLGRSNTTGHPYFSGLIGDTTVWTGVRTVSTAQPNTNDPGLIAFWASGGGNGDYCTNAGHIGNLSFFGNPRQAWLTQFDRGTEVDMPSDDWYNVAIQNAWTLYSTSYNAPGFFKDSSAMIHLRGVLTPGTSGTVAFTLPVNYRPEKIERISIAASTAGCYVEINNGGSVTPYLTGTPTWISLDGVRFRQYF